MSSNPLEQDPAREHRIREVAYHLWLADGKPHGRDTEYWERASELVGMEESAGAGLIDPVAQEAHMIDGQVIEEASIQENLGEIPGRFTDQGDRQQTPEPIRQPNRATAKLAVKKPAEKKSAEKSKSAEALKAKKPKKG